MSALVAWAWGDSRVRPEAMPKAGPLLPQSPPPQNPPVPAALSLVPELPGAAHGPFIALDSRLAHSTCCHVADHNNNKD